MRETLTAIAERYGCDKLYRHTYIPHYEEWFEPIRDSVRSVLEIGIGHEAMMTRRLPAGRVWILGASLRMWRDYFPNALVVGVDIQQSTMFEDERIQTVLANQGDESLLAVAKFAPFDVVVDDGSHHLDHQRVSCEMLRPHVRSGGLYVIEDVRATDSDGLAEAVGGTRIPSVAQKKWDDMVLVRL